MARGAHREGAPPAASAVMRSAPGPSHRTGRGTAAPVGTCSPALASWWRRIEALQPGQGLPAATGAGVTRGVKPPHSLATSSPHHAGQLRPVGSTPRCPRRRAWSQGRRTCSGGAPLERATPMSVPPAFPSRLSPSILPMSPLTVIPTPILRRVSSPRGAARSRASPFPSALRRATAQPRGDTEEKMCFIFPICLQNEGDSNDNRNP